MNKFRYISLEELRRDYKVENNVSDEILLNIRANEIIGRLKHEDYAPLPIEFYEWVVKSTGLKPVFVGQFEPSVYLDMLKVKFPNSKMHNLKPLEAFECLLYRMAQE